MKITTTKGFSKFLDCKEASSFLCLWNIGKERQYRLFKQHFEGNVHQTKNKERKKKNRKKDTKIICAKITDNKE